MSDASHALSAGNEALANGDIAQAERLLDRGLRLAPGNCKIMLALAGAKLLLRSHEAADLFATVARRHDMREAWLGLAIAHHQRNDPAEAATALGHALSRHAFISQLVPVAGAVIPAVNTPGWCGLDGTGRLIVQPSTHAAKPTAVLDGQPLTLRPQQGARTLVARLPDGWQQARTLVVTSANTPLLGSPVEIGAIVRVEGFVDSTNGNLHGWAWHPHDPDRDPVVSIGPLTGKPDIILVAKDPATAVRHERPMDQARSFYIPSTQLQHFAGLIKICGSDGRHLTGSPIDPSAERRSAEAAARYIARLCPATACKARTLAAPITRLPVPALPSPAGQPPPGGTAKRPVDVIVPVYDQIDLTLSCLASVLTDLPRWARIVVVDDASPDPRVRLELGRLAKRNRITLLPQPCNRGFPGAANIGLRHDRTRDAVLLNSDTLTPPGWLHRLRDAAYSAPEIGTATPMSNDGTIVSYPYIDRPNATPDLAETIQIDTLSIQTNAATVVDLPTAVGFCMYIKRDCLESTGLFREDLFAQGYGEENDFCLRARHLGWRHVAVPGVFVAHVGGQSFGSARHYLLQRNLRTLNQLHPGYDQLISDFQHRDPLADARRRLDTARWKTFRSKNKSVLLITHHRGGGVQRRVADRASALRAEGLRPIVLSPHPDGQANASICVVSDGPEGDTPNLRFAIPRELGMLARLLRGDRPLRAEVHHLIGHDHALLSLCQRLQIPYEIVIHDYAWLCPRVSLVGADNRYCGEPPVQHCEACIADAGTMNDEDIATPELRQRSATELHGAERIVAPSQDAAARLRRTFPQVRPEVVAWEDDAALPSAAPRPDAPDDIRRVCVVGAIGIAKGYETLLACARDAAMRKLNLEFRLVGHSMDDGKLLATNRVHVTGRYQEHEAVALIRAQHAHLGWLPSLWPETWCYTLTQAWQAGLNVVACDIGAQAERIRRTGRGWLYPLGLSATALNDRLLAL